jgi:short subunit dehydrogenase-like uncharacterized protein
MPGPSSQLLIYGANGYTGALVARRAVDRRVPVILAGRHAEAVASLATELGSAHRVFGLEDAALLQTALRGIGAVLNCAGPFSRTAAPLVEGCLRARVHYLDITGELEVLEALAGRGTEAKAAGVTLLPGAGFDVVPSDCLAAHVGRGLPSATRLTLAFETSGRMSRGTTITAIEHAHEGGVIRRDGRLVRVPSGWQTRAVDFGDGPRRAISIPWGDVATAYHTTGIGNIEVYAALPALVRASLRLARWAGPLLASPALQRWLEARARRGPAGPTDEQRARGASRLWAEASDGAGRVKRARLRAPEPYELTSWTALELAERALRGELPPGFQTPAGACGPDFVLGFPGVARQDVD